MQNNDMVFLYICKDLLLDIDSLDMNIVLILGHPNSASFNHALADACMAQLSENGHTVVCHDLYKEQFNPILGATESEQEHVLINQHCNDLSCCDGIIVIHPNWWGQPPAIVKGWLDKVLRPGLAYTFESDEQGVTRARGLLKARAAIVLNTSNTSDELEEELYKDPLETIWKNRVFKFCGINTVERVNFNVIRESDFEQRTAWLMEIKQLMNNYFPKQ